MIVGMYADGGISAGGKAEFGAWAYCLIDAEGKFVEWDYGVLLPACHGLAHVECNAAEFYAFLRGLEALPDGWSGKVYSDSQNTLNRFFQGWQMNGIPENWKMRMTLLERLGTLEPILLAGHPTAKQLLQGWRQKGTKRYPVSKYNVWCDRQCGQCIQAHREGRPPRVVII
jgi:ribonuclease HI